MSVNKFIAVLVVSLGIASSAFAASKNRELSLDGNFITTDSQRASLLNVSIGQLVTPQLAVVTSLMTQRNFVYSATTISVGGKFFFMDGFKGDLVPFAGLGIGLRLGGGNNNDANRGSTQYDVNAGAAYFLSDSTTIDGKVRLLSYNDSSPVVLLFSVGFSQRF